jgi:hypothetical protein
MKLINKDALVAEIEKRIKNLYPKGAQGMVVTKILKDHYEDLLSFLDHLEVKEVDLVKEPASGDLEVAARRYAKEEYSRKSPATLPDRCRACYAPIMYAFQGGAEWQREQMMKDAISGFIFGSRYFRQKNISLTDLSEEQYDKLKDFGERIKVIIIKE